MMSKDDNDQETASKVELVRCSEHTRCSAFKALIVFSVRPHKLQKLDEESRGYCGSSL